MTTFDNIKKYSRERGFSLRETAKRAGLSENALYRYNQGIEPKFETLKSISDVLDIPISKLSDKYKNDSSKNAKEVDIDDLSTVMRFGGKEIPEEDRETIINMLKSLRKARKEKDDI